MTLVYRLYCIWRGILGCVIDIGGGISVDTDYRCAWCNGRKDQQHQNRQTDFRFLVQWVEEQWWYQEKLHVYRHEPQMLQTLNNNSRLFIVYNFRITGAVYATEKSSYAIGRVDKVLRIRYERPPFGPAATEEHWLQPFVKCSGKGIC